MKTPEHCLEITWLGHAAFLLEAADGMRVLLDPYRAPDIGTYQPIDLAADVVVASHLNPKYHSHWDAASGSPVRLNGLDFAGDPNGINAHGINFRAVRAWESPERTVPVSMPYFRMDGITVCHSGDLGHGLTAEEAVPLVGIDVFLAVAGSPPTIALPELKALIDLIRPKIVIPMHYGNGKINLPLRPVEDFLALFAPSQVVRRDSPALTICAGDLPAEMQVIVLPSAN